MQDKGIGIDTVAMSAGMGLSELAKWQPKWTIKKYDKDMKLYETENIDGNKLLLEGIIEFIKVACGIGGTAFSSANAYIGVGDGTIDVEENQTGLQGSNKTYRPMDATYPKVVNNTMIFRSTFGPNFGNHQWREFTVANGPDDSYKNLNRKVETQPREKFNPDTWVIELQVTIS